MTLFVLYVALKVILADTGEMLLENGKKNDSQEGVLHVRTCRVDRMVELSSPLPTIISHPVSVASANSLGTDTNGGKKQNIMLLVLTVSMVDVYSFWVYVILYTPTDALLCPRYSFSHTHASTQFGRGRPTSHLVWDLLRNAQSLNRFACTYIMVLGGYPKL